jgi:archaellum biogenesis ATPase FlaH
MKGDTMEKQILKKMLDKSFYDQYKGSVSSSVFEGDLGSLFDTIKRAHSEYEESIKVDELYGLHTTMYNPALTRAAKIKFNELIEDLKDIQEPSNEIAKDIMKVLVERETAQKIAVEATEIFNGKPANFNDIISIIEKHKTNTPDEKVGNLMIVFARPETGKTAFWVSLVSSPDGFAEQGAKVHAFINEEPAVRTQMRAISCYTGMTREEIVENIEIANSKWDLIKENIQLYDTVDWTMDDIDSHCEKHKPDIIVIDQLDKVNISGIYARSDEKLRAIYTSAREIAKRRKCAIIAIHMDFNMMENSRTGKAAEADLIIGVGKAPDTNGQENIDRSLCISKNKINGYHGIIDAKIYREISRYDV